MEKDLLIYNELCKHGQEVFSWLMKQDKGNLKRYSDFKKRNASFLSENLRKLKYDAHSEYWNTPISIVVDTFCCEFLPISVFGLMAKFKTISKGKEYIFEYEEETEEKLATINVEFDDANFAKKLADSTETDNIYFALCFVLLEMNKKTGDVNFVATDGRKLSVISNSVDTIGNAAENEDFYRAFFDVSTWKQICDLAKKNKNTVKFEIFKDGESLNEKAISIVGDKRLYSTSVDSKFPNWHAITIKEKEEVRLTKQGQKEFDAYLKSVLKMNKTAGIQIYFLEGDNRLYCSFKDEYFKQTLTSSFELEKTCSTTGWATILGNQLKDVGFAGFRSANNKGASSFVSKFFDYTLVAPKENESFDKAMEERKKRVFVA